MLANSHFFLTLRLVSVLFVSIEKGMSQLVSSFESLEADNFHDDPHADLVMSKKALNLFQEVQHGSDHMSPSASNTSGTASLMGNATNASSGAAPKPPKRRLKTAEYYKQR